MAARNGEKKRTKMHGTNDAFLSSMTFASGGIMRNCDCDECDFIPAPIADAIREHKRQRTLAQSRTQDRSLVARHGAISVWKLTMPIDAEPLIEFGNSHRIVLIDTLSPKSSVLSIGKGVVGSSDEEKGRTKMTWTKRSAWLIPQNGGRAVGWVHIKDNKDSKDPVGHAIMYVIKIPPEVLEKDNGEAVDLPEWAESVLEICGKNLNESTESNDGKGSNGLSVKLSEDDICRLRKHIDELLDNDD